MTTILTLNGETERLWRAIKKNWRISEPDSTDDYILLTLFGMWIDEFEPGIEKRG
jgi:hypothetical protein